MVNKSIVRWIYNTIEHYLTVIRHTFKLPSDTVNTLHNILAKQFLKKFKPILNNNMYRNHNYINNNSITYIKELQRSFVFLIPR